MLDSLLSMISAPKDNAALCPRCRGIIAAGAHHQTADCLTITAARLAALEAFVLQRFRQQCVHEDMAQRLDCEAEALAVDGCPWPRPVITKKEAR